MRLWPSTSVIFGDRRRKKMSLLPPGAAGLITRSGLLGNGCAPSCALQRRKAKGERRKGSQLLARRSAVTFAFRLSPSALTFILLPFAFRPHPADGATSPARGP